MLTHAVKSSGILVASTTSAGQDWRSSGATWGSHAEDRWTESSSMHSSIRSDLATLNTDCPERWSSRSDAAIIEATQLETEILVYDTSKVQGFEASKAMTSIPSTPLKLRPDDNSSQSSKQGSGYFRQGQLGSRSLPPLHIPFRGQLDNDREDTSDVCVLSRRPTGNSAPMEPSPQATAYHDWHFETATKQPPIPATLVCGIGGCCKSMASANALREHRKQHAIKKCSLCGGAYEIALKRKHRCKPNVSVMVHSALNKMSGKKT